MVLQAGKTSVLDHMTGPGSHDLALVMSHDPPPLITIGLFQLRYSSFICNVFYEVDR